MFLPETFSVALIMMITSTICWGSWASTYKLTRNYRFELFYWDYAIGIVAISLVYAWAMGSAGGPDSFLANIRAADAENIAWALLGGAIFNVANLLLVAGIAMAGLAVAFPISIGIALVVGVVLSYTLQPKGDVRMLALGVMFAILAVIFVGKAYSSLPSAQHAVSRKSILVCAISGVLMGLFAPFVARALTSGHALTPYSISVFFTIGAFVCSFVANGYLMRRPLVGEPVDARGYLRARPADHALGVLGGAVWGTGMVFNFVAAGLVGVAVSYAIGQASPMVAALWGVLVWKEFTHAGTRSWWYLAGMFASYGLALLFVASAYTSAG